jgi:hypothetical protein
VRVHRDDLLQASALARVGRELVVFGAAYTRWLQRKASRVADFDIAPNANRSVSSRIGCAKQPTN